MESFVIMFLIVMLFMFGKIVLVLFNNIIIYLRMCIIIYSFIVINYIILGDFKENINYYVFKFICEIICFFEFVINYNGYCI